MIIEGPDQVTQAVLDEIARAPNPRFREVMTALVKHLHAFIREAKLTEEEFHQACAIINAIGQNSNAFHNEAVLMSGSLGVSTLVCLLNNGNNGATETTANLLGPFWRLEFAAHRKRRLDHPLADAGAGAVRQRLGQGPRRQAGRRRRGRRLAVLDRGPLREPGPDPGRHEPARQVHHRRRRPHLVPQHQAGGLSDPDQRAGRRSAASAQGRHNMRPAHLHFLIYKPGFKTHISQVYLPDDPNIETDVQFGVTRRLLGDYVRHENEKPPAPGVKDPWFSLDYTFIMEPGTAKLPRPPIQDKAKTTDMRPQYLPAVNRAPAMAK